LTKVSSGLDYLATGKWPEATKAVETHQKAIWELSLTDQQYADLIKEISDDQRRQNEVWKESQPFMEQAAKLHQQQEAAAKKYADALSALLTVTQGYQGAVDALDGQTVEAIKFYLDAGVAQEKLATAYGLTVQQIKAVSLELKAENDARKAEQDQIDAATKLWDNYYKTIAAEDKSTVQGQIANIWAWAQAQYDALDKAKKWSQDAADAITATATAQAEQAKRVDMEKDKFSQQYYAKQASDAHAHLEAVQADWTNHTMAEIDLLQQQANAADDSLAHWQDAATAAMDQTQPPINATTNALHGLSAAANQAAAAIGQMPSSSATWRNPATGQIESWDWKMEGQGLGGGVRAAGGPVDAGVPYLVGERGPELFVPSTSGSIVPNGGGPSIQNTFHLVDTESNLARRVADIVMQSIRNGVRLNGM